MTRNIPLFAIASAPVLSDLISKTLNKTSHWKNFDRRFVNLVTPSRPYLFPVLLITFAIGFFAYNHSQGRQTYQFNPQVFPVHAVDWLEKHPIEGNMFNEFNWGGYLLYRTWPRDLVFVDSQSDFYGEPLMFDYQTILLTQNNWMELLDQYEIDWVIAAPPSPLGVQLERDHGWITVYRDTVTIIIKRK